MLAKLLRWTIVEWDVYNFCLFDIFLIYSTLFSAQSYTNFPFYLWQFSRNGVFENNAVFSLCIVVLWLSSWALSLPVLRWPFVDGRIWAEIISQIPPKRSDGDCGLSVCRAVNCCCSSSAHNFEKFTWAFLAPNPSVADWSSIGLHIRLFEHIKTPNLRP